MTMDDREGHRPAKERTPSPPSTSAPRATYLSLGSRGLAPAEAGNLTAFMNGLRPVEQGWTVAEIGRLLFLRDLVERGRLGS